MDLSTARRSTISGLLTAAALLVSLQVPPAEAARPPVYDVEVIVFTNEIVNDGGERWGSPDADAIRPSGFFPEDQFTELAARYYTLNHIGAALERSASHSVLFHRAWRQLAYDKSRAVAYPVHSIAENRYDSVEGVIKLVRGRFLHLDVNLHLMSAVGGAEVMFSDGPNSKPEFELVESRRIKSNVLHYFDHPRFGLIAKVTPYIRKNASAPVKEEAAQDTPEAEKTEQPNPADDQLTR